MGEMECFRRSYVESLCSGRSLLVGTGCECIPHLLNSFNIDVVVTLFERDECPDYVLEALRQASKSRGVRVYHYPIRDYSVDPVENLVAAVDMIANSIREGRAVLVSCYGGCGRTGTVVSLLNIAYRCMSHEAAIDYYTRRRGCGPESPDQLTLLYEAARIAKSCSCSDVLCRAGEGYDPSCVLKGLLDYTRRALGY